MSFGRPEVRSCVGGEEENASRFCWSPGIEHQEASQGSMATSETGYRSKGSGIAPGRYFCPSKCSHDIINSKHLLRIYVCQAPC
jgi:hypothetical protein